MSTTHENGMCRHHDGQEIEYFCKKYSIWMCSLCTKDHEHQNGECNMLSSEEALKFLKRKKRKIQIDVQNEIQEKQKSMEKIIESVKPFTNYLQKKIDENLISLHDKKSFQKNIENLNSTIENFLVSIDQVHSDFTDQFVKLKEIKTVNDWMTLEDDMKHSTISNLNSEFNKISDMNDQIHMKKEALFKISQTNDCILEKRIEILNEQICYLQHVNKKSNEENKNMKKSYSELKKTLEKSKEENVQMNQYISEMKKTLEEAIVKNDRPFILQSIYFFKEINHKKNWARAVQSKRGLDVYCLQKGKPRGEFFEVKYPQKIRIKEIFLELKEHDHYRFLNITLDENNDHMTKFITLVTGNEGESLKGYLIKKPFDSELNIGEYEDGQFIPSYKMEYVSEDTLSYLIYFENIFIGKTTNCPLIDNIRPGKSRKIEITNCGIII